MSPNAYCLTPDDCYCLSKSLGLVCTVCNNIGYAFHAPLPSWEWTEDATAHCEQLFIYCHQSKEGHQTWYAFSHPQERLMFLELIEFDGIGPGRALEALSKTSFKMIKQLVETGDKVAFLKLPVFRGKLGAQVATKWFVDKPVQPVATQIVLDRDAVGALVTLGLKATDAKAKVQAVQEAQPTASTQDIIIACLRS